MVEQRSCYKLINLRSRVLFKQIFDSAHLITNLTSGCICGVVLVIYAISFAALIFSGDLSAYISTGIGIALFTGMITSLVITLMSSLPGVIVAPQEAPAIILGLIASAIAAGMPASATSTEILYTVVIAIALTSFLTGTFCFILGTFKLGELTRLIPYPVVGGFLAGTGWLLSWGALNLMTDIPLTLAHLSRLFQPDTLLRWLPGTCFAILLLVILRRYKHVLLLPGMVLGAIGLFYLLLLLTQTSIAEARNDGLLLNSFPAKGMWQPLQPAMFLQANWHLIFGQMGQILTVLPLTAMALLLNCTGIELATGREIDPNRELRATGIAALIASLGGGIIGFHGLGLSTLSLVKMGAKSRWVGLIAAAVCGITLFAGSSIVSLVPKPVLGGVTLFLGLSFLVEWVYDSWFKLPKLDYGVVLLILLMTATVGFLQGVAIGLGVAIVLAVMHYSRTHVIRTVTLGAIPTHKIYTNPVYRPPYQKQRLGKEREQIRVFELQGFLFFGNASKLLNQIRHQLDHAISPTPRFVVLDFRLVKELDSSATLSFVKLEQLAHRRSLILVFTNLTPAMQRKLYLGGCFQVQPTASVCFPTLEEGLTWCEDRLLADFSWGHYCPLSLALRLDEWFCHTEQVAIFAGYLEEREVIAGEVIFRQGDRADWLYLIESGQIDRVLITADCNSEPVQSLYSGDLAGEVEFYRQSTYSTAAIAIKPSKLYGLSRSALQHLKQEHPEVASVWQEFVIHHLSDRFRVSLTQHQTFNRMGSQKQGNQDESVGIC